MQYSQDSGEEYNNDDDYSDDDDVSWKVRRAAAKCISAIISSRPDMLAEQYSCLSPALIKRFKEREDNVKTDIFEAYITLLKQTKAFSILRGRDALDANDMDTDGPIVLLQQQVREIGMCRMEIIIIFYFTIRFILTVEPR